MIEINKEKVEIWITMQGIIIGELDKYNTEDDRVFLNYPMLLKRNNEGFYLGNVILEDDEYIDLPKATSSRISMRESIIDEYIKNVLSNHNRIIVPEKRIII